MLSLFRQPPNWSPAFSFPPSPPLNTVQRDLSTKRNRSHPAAAWFSISNRTGSRLPHGHEGPYKGPQHSLLVSPPTTSSTTQLISHQQHSHLANKQTMHTRVFHSHCCLCLECSSSALPKRFAFVTTTCDNKWLPPPSLALFETDCSLLCAQICCTKLFHSIYHITLCCLRDYFPPPRVSELHKIHGQCPIQHCHPRTWNGK